jgi:hypothetical protein
MSSNNFNENNNVTFVGIQATPQGNIQRSGSDYNLFLPTRDTTINLVAGINSVLTLQDRRNNELIQKNIDEIKKVFEGGLVGTISGANYFQQVVGARNPRIERKYGYIQPFGFGPIPYQDYLVITLTPSAGTNLPIGPYNAVNLSLSSDK